MTTGRLEAFSDGVIAILITIMVLGLRIPHGSQWNDLRPVVPTLLTYVLSFIYIGIYWVNHHHLLQRATSVSGGVLLSNLILLFCLSLVPFATGWMGQSHFAPIPVSAYGIVLLAAAMSYFLLQNVIVAHEGPDSLVALALGRDFKGKISLVLYASAIGLSYVNRWIGVTIYVIVAVMWIIPDRRLERPRVPRSVELHPTEPTAPVD